MSKYAEWFVTLPPRNVNLVRELDTKFNLGIFDSVEFQFDYWMRIMGDIYTHSKAIKLVLHRIPIDYSSKLIQLYFVCDGRDSMVVKYFYNIRFFRNRYRETCQHYGAENSRDHAEDECMYYSDFGNAVEKIAKWFSKDKLLYYQRFTFLT